MEGGGGRVEAGKDYANTGARPPMKRVSRLTPAEQEDGLALPERHFFQKSQIIKIIPSLFCPRIPIFPGTHPVK